MNSRDAAVRALQRELDELRAAVRDFFDAYSDWERDDAETRLRDLLARAEKQRALVTRR